MTTLSITVCCITVLPAALAAAQAATTRAAGDDPETLRVMTFNIRCATANDGANNWVHRRAHLLRRIHELKPDVLGAQEVVAQQADELRQAMDGYAFLGVGRDDGKSAGEFSPILYRRDRFEVEDWGTMWLSERPGQIGSKGWDAALPRIATWAVLRSKAPGGSRLAVINTHFDHIGQRARFESARLLRSKADALSENGKIAVVVMGDLNCTEDDEPYQALVTTLVDGYRTAHPARSKDEATFHAFEGRATGSRIDFILHNAKFVTVESEIDRANAAGRYPSDHFAVTSVLKRVP